MELSVVEEVIVAILLVLGCLMSLAAGIGLLRFPDLLSRMHAATKPQVLGLLCLLVAVAIKAHQWVWVPVLVLVWVLQAITAPVGAHMVGRAAYRSKHLKQDTLVQDDLAAVVASAQATEDARGEDVEARRRLGEDEETGRLEGEPAAEPPREAEPAGEPDPEPADEKSGAGRRDEPGTA